MTSGGIEGSMHTTGATVCAAWSGKLRQPLVIKMRTHSFDLKVAPVGAVALVASALVAGCSSTETLSSAYLPTAPVGSSTADVYRGTSDYASYAARDRALASRPQLHTYNYGAIYAGTVDEGVTIPAFDYTKINSRYLRQQVNYFGPEAPGTIVVDARRKLLYLVEPNGVATRYGIAVGKEGYGWTGSAVLQWKQTWPTWTPPKEMIERKPELAKYAEGMQGDADNPLGARAMYLFKNGKDTLYRIHGTTKPFSIGKAASSGCFRMINQDVIDLYSRVNRKASVQVRPQISAEITSGR